MTIAVKAAFDKYELLGSKRKINEIQYLAGDSVIKGYSRSMGGAVTIVDIKVSTNCSVTEVNNYK